MLARGTLWSKLRSDFTPVKRPVIETEFSFDWVVVADCNRNGTLTVTRKPTAKTAHIDGHGHVHSQHLGASAAATNAAKSVVHH